MRIDELLARGRQFVSLEFFPPKEKDAWPAFFYEVGKLSALDPLFVSVTYGAGGSTQANTLELVTRFSRDFGLNPMAHLTCVGALGSRSERLPEGPGGRRGGQRPGPARRPPPGTSRLQARERRLPARLGLGRVHPRSLPEPVHRRGRLPGNAIPRAHSLEADIGHLKLKLERGGNFAITQMFFRQRRLFRFRGDVSGQGDHGAHRSGRSADPEPGLHKAHRLPVRGRPFRRTTCRAWKRPPSGEAPRLCAGKGWPSPGASAWTSSIAGAPGVHLYTLNKAQSCLEIARDLPLS